MKTKSATMLRCSNKKHSSTRGFSENRLIWNDAAPDQPGGLAEQASQVSAESEIRPLEEVQHERENTQEKQKQRHAEEEAEKEVEQRNVRFEMLQQEVDSINNVKTKIIEELKQNGLYDTVHNSRDSWLIDRSYGVDKERVLQGIEPATYYDEGDLDGMVMGTRNPFAYSHSRETLSVDGEKYPAKIHADWDSRYPGRTIDLHVNENGADYYRSYVYPDHLVEWLEDTSARYKKVDVKKLQQEESASGFEAQFDASQGIEVKGSSLEDDTKNAPKPAQTRAKYFNNLLKKAQKKVPKEMDGTVYKLLFEGIEYRALNDGTIVTVVKGDIAPVFRKYWKTLFNHIPGQTFAGAATKYPDGSYAIKTAPEAILSDLYDKMNKFSHETEEGIAALQYLETSESGIQFSEVENPGELPETKTVKDILFFAGVAHADIFHQRKDGVIVVNDPGAEKKEGVEVVEFRVSKNGNSLETENELVGNKSPLEFREYLKKVRRETFATWAGENNDVISEASRLETEWDSGNKQPEELTSLYKASIEAKEKICAAYRVTAKENEVAQYRVESAEQDIQAMNTRIEEISG